MNISFFKRDYAWLWLVVLAFVLVYLGSLTFVYVEGDDAATVAYHIMGRDPDFQLPYAPYHGMMDVVLSVFPADQDVLLVVAVLITAVAEIGMTVLILALAFDWMGELSWLQKLVIAGLLLLAVPEFFYLGLVYSPASLGMCFVLGAHLLLRYAARETGMLDINRPRDRWLFLLSVVMFGLGVAFRWSVLPYGAVIALDLLIGVRKGLSLSPLTRRFLFVVGWGVVALIASVAVVFLSGYGPRDIIGSTQSTVSYVAGQAGGQQVEAGPIISFRTLTTLLSLFTPAFAIAFVVGFVTMLRRRDPLLLVLLVGLLGVFPYWPSGVPKFLITAIPPMILCGVVGMRVLWYKIDPERLRLAARVVFAVVVIVPWFAGVLVMREGSAWGPGFEMRPFDREEVKGLQFGLRFGSGAALPSPEGERAFFGHFFTFFGDWRGLYLERIEEHQRIVEQAIEQDIPIVMMRWAPAYITNVLVRKGFMTDDAYDHTLTPDDYFVERRFVNPESQEVIFWYHEIEGEGTEEDWRAICSLVDLSETVVFDSYPRVVRNLYEIAPETMERLGSTSAVIDLEQLCQQID